MNNKLCCKCKKTLEHSFFSKNKLRKDGLNSVCKNCQKEYSKKIYIKKKSKIKLIQKKYYNENKEKIKKRQISYKEQDKKLFLEKNNKSKKRYYIKNKEEIKQKSKKYYKINQEKIKNNSKKYYNENKEKIKNQTKTYAEKNKEIIKIQSKKQKEQYRSRRNFLIKKRKDTDKIFSLKETIRQLIRSSMRKNGFLKKQKTEEILGCSFEDFIKHIESKFEPWMNWNNYGNWNGIPKEKNIAWDIDHIIPLDTAKTEEEIIKLNHYQNLRPFCSYANRWIKRNHL